MNLSTVFYAHEKWAEVPGMGGAYEVSDDPHRNFSVDSLELYITKTKDLTPVYYLIDKFLQEKSAKQDQALAQLAPILAQLAPLMRQAGLTA